MIFFFKCSGTPSQSKSSSGGAGTAKAQDTVGDISSMTSGSFDRSSADGKAKKEKASVKKMADVKKIESGAKGLPMISEKSASPSELSAT